MNIIDNCENQAKQNNLSKNLLRNILDLPALDCSCADYYRMLTLI